eukprot:621671-Amphidinium_carterae.1
MPVLHIPLKPQFQVWRHNASGGNPPSTLLRMHGVSGARLSVIRVARKKHSYCKRGTWEATSPSSKVIRKRKFAVAVLNFWGLAGIQDSWTNMQRAPAEIQEVVPAQAVPRLRYMVWNAYEAPITPLMRMSEDMGQT